MDSVQAEVVGDGETDGPGADDANVGIEVRLLAHRCAPRVILARH